MENKRIHVSKTKANKLDKDFLSLQKLKITQT